MSKINYQALREKAERAIPAMERLLMLPVDDDLLSEQELKDYGVDIDALNAFKFLAGPETVLALLDELEAAEKRNAKLQSENAYIRNRYKELDLLIGKNILVMQAAIIEWQATGDAKSGLAWIYNTLFGPGELPDESEKDAQAYFNRKYAPIDEKLMALHKWFWEQSEAERAAANIGVKGK
ncbi:ead/Ea22-like family protein [Shigella sonnei]|uniref:ead/Ea22-like family protein n=1 Tax=Shigella sonnei TaxID=624 RepID=UPI0024BCFD8A|nr:ead/Ea22-like family protein [Shigella sonnei]HCR6164378.1 ead/Ea22-like family protein [Shigella sonnei]